MFEAMENSTTSNNPHNNHVYFRYQSSTVSFAEWITLFTLCLAPLLTHIGFGYANPILLSQRVPTWRDRLPQFHPITVVWRWYAIVNRRLRATNWDRADMAATNAIFWDGYQWSGSEELMSQSRNWITKQPQYTRVNWVSASTLATVFMTLQGVAAILRLRLVVLSIWSAPTSGLPDIFYPLAVLSLARLPASPWLCKDYAYEVKSSRQQYHNDITTTDPEHTISATDKPYNELSCPEVSINAVSEIYHGAHPIYSSPFDNILIQSLNDSDNPTTTRLKPPTKLTHIWTIFTLLFTLVLCAAGIYLSFYNLGPHPGIIHTRLSTLLTSVFYLVLSFSTALIFIWHLIISPFVFGARYVLGDTVIPCMNSWWYKLLNYIIMALALAMVIANALETKMAQNSDGQAWGSTTYAIPPPKS